MIDYFVEARVIRLQDIRQKLTDIKELVRQKIIHPYLIKFIEAPYIDDDKILILILIMDHLELSYKQIQNYALSTMLVQIALDTHDHISNISKMDEENADQSTRQLTVLAGDYYSGLYYKLLADSDDISIIRVLASGIKEVNEHKIFVYQKEFDGIDKLMTSIKIIESSLYTKLSDYFQVSFWNEIVSNFLFVKRLLIEKKQYIHAGSSQLFEAMMRVIFPKQQLPLSDLSNEQHKYLLVVCDRYIELSKHFIEMGFQQLPTLNEWLEQRMMTMINQHHPNANTLVEEG